MNLLHFYLGGVAAVFVYILFVSEDDGELPEERPEYLEFLFVTLAWPIVAACCGLRWLKKFIGRNAVDTPKETGTTNAYFTPK